MDRWGVAGCTENRSEIVRQLLPRAKKWLKDDMEYASRALSVPVSVAMSIASGLKVDDLAVRVALGQFVDLAIRRAKDHA